MGAEEESVEQAANARRERLMALRAAQELSSTPDDDGLTPNGNKEVTAAEDEPIEQAAAERRERLKALREAKELMSMPDEDSAQNGSKAEDSEENKDKGLNMKFRNYLPHDKQLQEGKLAPAVLPKFEDPVAAAPTMTEKIEDPFVNIAPKKPNWDLRRDVQKRLDKLERRTQKAIYELMQEQDREKEKEAEAMDVENATE